MSKSDWNETIEEIKYKSPAFLITVGIICLICSFIAFWNGSIDYRIQQKQSVWSTKNATVSFVEEITKRPYKPFDFL